MRHRTQYSNPPFAKTNKLRVFLEPLNGKLMIFLLSRKMIMLISSIKYFWMLMAKESTYNHNRINMIKLKYKDLYYFAVAFFTTLYTFHPRMSKNDGWFSICHYYILLLYISGQIFIIGFSLKCKFIMFNTSWFIIIITGSFRVLYVQNINEYFSYFLKLILNVIELSKD